MKLELKIRRLVIQIDEIHQEMQKNVDPPARKALAAGVFHNPYAGRYVEDLEPCLLYTSPSPRDGLLSRMPSSA